MPHLRSGIGIIARSEGWAAVWWSAWQQALARRARAAEGEHAEALLKKTPQVLKAQELVRAADDAADDGG